jgi:hypothetical protein
MIALWVKFAYPSSVPFIEKKSSVPWIRHPIKGSIALWFEQNGNSHCALYLYDFSTCNCNHDDESAEQSV